MGCTEWRSEALARGGAEIAELIGGPADADQLGFCGGACQGRQLSDVIGEGADLVASGPDR